MPHDMRQIESRLDTPSTKRYYEEHAESYARETGSADLQHVWPLLTKRLAPESLILDLGCGAGRDLAYFAKAGFRVIGLDYSLNLLRIAKTVSRQKVVLADLGMPPFAPATFDAVWALASLLHVPRYRIRTVLSDIRGLLKPPGLFLASIREGRGERVDERGRYFASYRPVEWEALLAATGFRRIDFRLTKESRTIASGKAVEISWLVSLCTTDEAADAPKEVPAWIGIGPAL